METKCNAKHSSIRRSLLASHFPWRPGSASRRHFPARRRVITTFSSTEQPPFALASVISSCFLPRLPYLSVVTLLPLLLFLQAQQTICTLQLIYCFVLPLVTTHKKQADPECCRRNIYSPSDNSEQAELWIIRYSGRSRGDCSNN